MMAIHIPPDMIPRMDWTAVDKQAAWAFYRERLEQYFVIAGTPKEVKVTHILFYGGKEASEPWTALKDQVEGNKDDADTVFKAFANSFKKSSSHWQARDEYLSDIKQDKNQTTAELDIYIKDLIRRCQLPPEDQESHKIDLLYHATAHFQVRKFVHNAKQEELKYDRMIKVAKAHERTCQEYQIHRQDHSMANPSNSYSNPLIQTNALSKSFQKGPPKKTCGKCRRSHSHGDCPAHRTTCSKCIPLSHFRCLFPQLCRKDGTPKENALEPTLAQFEAYDGGIMTSHRWIILPTRDIRDNKFHPLRYYVVTREEARTLISHATATWLVLMKVLCPNKAPRIKRQVASVSNKATEPSDSNNSNSLSGLEHPPKVKYFSNNKITTPQHPPKMKYTGTVTVKEQQYE